MKTTNIPILKIANGTIGEIAVSAELDFVEIVELDDEVTDNIGTSKGGWLTNYKLNLYAPGKYEKLILL